MNMKALYMIGIVAEIIELRKLGLTDIEIEGYIEFFKLKENGE